jgi:hypothetical protein
VRTELDRRVLARVLDAKHRCEDRQSKVRGVLLATYEAMPGDPRFCVRRLEVVEHAARALGIQVLNNAVFADVEAAASALGFQAVKNGNRSLFRCAKRRDYDHGTALAVSRENRRDARWAKVAAKREASTMRGATTGPPP